MMMNRYSALPTFFGNARTWEEETKRSSREDVGRDVGKENSMLALGQ